MRESFRCGRLKSIKDGKKTPMKITEGGGIRNCPWEGIDMNLDEVHEKLRQIFGLDPNEDKSILCDFEREPLDKKRFPTFFQYVRHYGLKFNNTLIYIWTPSGRENAIPRPRPITVVPPRPTSRTTSRSTSRSTPKLTSAPAPFPAPAPAPAPATNPKPTRVEADSSTPTVLIKIDDDDDDEDDEPTAINVKREDDYSFDQSLNDLAQSLRIMTVGSSGQEIIVKLFEDICTLRGLASIVLDRLKKEMESSTINSQTLYNETLEKISTLSRTIKVSLDLNKMTLRRYPTLVEKFSRFDEQFKTLRHRWENSSQPIHMTRSTTAKTNKPEEDNQFFSPLRKPLEELLEVIGFYAKSSSFHHSVASMTREIRTCTGLTNRKEKLLSIEKRLTNKINEQYRRRAPHSVPRDLQHAVDRTLDVIRYLLNSMKNVQPERRSTRWSTPPPPPTTSPQPTTRTSNQRTHKTEPRDDDHDDLSSEASHSSFGDEVLMEVARNAYEDRPRR